MNKYFLIRRLMGPSILLLLGIVALLHQADLVSWNIFVPLLLILIGVLKLAQRAVLATMGDEPIYPGYPGSYSGYQGGPYPYGAPPAGTQTPTQTGTSIVPAPPQNQGGSNGGQQ
jgi:hypothetical protein